MTNMGTAARPGRQLRFWLIGLAVLVVLVWLLHNMLFPFVAATAIAYFLDPLADRLETVGVPRLAATLTVLLSFVVLAVLALLLVAPLIQAQMVDLAMRLPSIIAWARTESLYRLHSLVTLLSPEDMERLRGAAGEYAGTLVSWLATVLRGLFLQGAALFNVASVMFITPVVAFYLLRDWDRMVATLDGWLPRQYAATIREQMRAVDHTLAGFVRGQASVCVALAIYYALAMSVVGLDFGLVIGLVAGCLSFVPYVGTLVGFCSSVGVALFQFQEEWRIGLVVALFAVGHILEGYVLTPRLVGGKVGLHPVWVMFALLAGGSLFGFTGVLLAVPMAAVIGVLIRFALRQYLSSSYYTGEEGASGPLATFPPDDPLAHPAAATGSRVGDLPPMAS